MCHDLWKVYWMNEMKKDITKFAVKYLNCQQVKVKHHKSIALDKNISIPT